MAACYHARSNILMTPVDHKTLHFTRILPGGCYQLHLAPTLRVHWATRLLLFTFGSELCLVTLQVITWPFYFTLGNFLIRTSVGGPAILVTVVRLFRADRNAAVFNTNFYSRRDLSEYWRVKVVSSFNKQMWWQRLKTHVNRKVRLLHLP